MIIGIVGPLCSGKDAVGEILAEKGFKVISTGDVLRAEMKEKGIEITRDNIQKYVRKMRKEVGFAYPSDRISKKMEEGKNYVIQGLRNEKEGKELKKLESFYLVSIDSPEDIRFQRMKQRAREKDPVTFEEFKKIDETELHSKGKGGYGFNIRACMDLADFNIVNSGTLESLKEKIERILEEIRGKES